MGGIVPNCTVGDVRNCWLASSSRVDPPQRGVAFSQVWSLDPCQGGGGSFFFRARGIHPKQRNRGPNFFCPDKGPPNIFPPAFSLIQRGRGWGSPTLKRSLGRCLVHEANHWSPRLPAAASGPGGPSRGPPGIGPRRSLPCGHTHTRVGRMGYWAPCCPCRFGCCHQTMGANMLSYFLCGRL